jgi:hypothetical protein
MSSGSWAFQKYLIKLKWLICFFQINVFVIFHLNDNLPSDDKVFDTHSHFLTSIFKNFVYFLKLPWI